MNTQEINDALKNKNFYGAFARDELPKIRKRPAGFIVNTDSHTEPGEHWVAIYLLDGISEYFDPFGFPPLHRSTQRFMNENSPNGYIYNCRTIQDASSTQCGKFCLLFLKRRMKNQSYASIVDMFGRNLKRNDEILDSLF